MHRIAAKVVQLRYARSVSFVWFSRLAGEQARIIDQTAGLELQSRAAKQKPPGQGREVGSGSVGNSGSRPVGTLRTVRPGKQNPPHSPPYPPFPHQPHIRHLRGHIYFPPLVSDLVRLI